MINRGLTDFRKDAHISRIRTRAFCVIEPLERIPTT